VTIGLPPAGGITRHDVGAARCSVCGRRGPRGGCWWGRQLWLHAHGVGGFGNRAWRGTSGRACIIARSAHGVPAARCTGCGRWKARGVMALVADWRCARARGAGSVGVRGSISTNGLPLAGGITGHCVDAACCSVCGRRGPRAVSRWGSPAVAARASVGLLRTLRAGRDEWPPARWRPQRTRRGRCLLSSPRATGGAGCEVVWCRPPLCARAWGGLGGGSGIHFDKRAPACRRDHSPLRRRCLLQRVRETGASGREPVGL
jgi:hypothetical protein